MFVILKQKIVILHSSSWFNSWSRLTTLEVTELSFAAMLAAGVFFDEQVKWHAM
jgi:hypothetical protein